MHGDDAVNDTQHLTGVRWTTCQQKTQLEWGSNSIESIFGTIRHRTRRTKGCLTRDGLLHMMFKIGQYAEAKWRNLRGFNYLAKVINGVKFKDGIEVESDNQVAA
jgi:putative transposase